MKIFCALLFILLLTTATKLMAANPGSNYGCLRWNVRFYTNYWKDEAAAPNNPGWTGPFHYYNAGGSSFAVDYGLGGCGKINPSIPSQYISAGGTCFIYDGGIYYQGELGTYDRANVTECDLDGGVALLLIVVSLISVRKIMRRGVDHS